MSRTPRDIPGRDTRAYDAIAIHQALQAAPPRPSPFLVISHPFREDDAGQAWQNTRLEYVWCLPLPYILAGTPTWEYSGVDVNGEDYVPGTPEITISGEDFPLQKVRFYDRIGTSERVRGFEGAPLPGDTIFAVGMRASVSGSRDYIISHGSIRTMITGTINVDGRIDFGVGQTSVPVGLAADSFEEDDTAVAWWNEAGDCYYGANTTCTEVIPE